MIVLREKRSAITPAAGPRKVVGINLAIRNQLTAPPEPVNLVNNTNIAI